MSVSKIEANAEGRAEPNGHPFADAAPRYLERGWPGVLPLPVGRKFPPPKGYTGDGGRVPTLQQITRWAETRPGGNVALRLPRSVVGIDVDAYAAKTGKQTLAEAERRWGPLPPTPRSTSREDGVSGIRIYRVPRDVKLPGNIKFELDDGSTIGDIEIVQNHHRYMVVEPSAHPEGGRYRWVDDDGTPVGIPAVDDLPELPAEWVEGLTATETATPAPTVSESGEEAAETGTAESAGEARDFGAAVAEALTEGSMSPAVLAWLGNATGACTGTSRYDHMVMLTLAALRLGRQGEPGVRAALLALRGVYVDAVAEARDGGSKAAVAEFDRAVAGAGGELLSHEPTAVDDLPADFGRGERDERQGGGAAPLDGWSLFVDVGAVLDGNTAPRAVPTVLARTDGKCLFYKDKNNLLFGDPETAKTWVGLAAGAEVLTGGGRFAFVDMDHNGVDTTVERLLLLGVDPAVLRDPDRFRYVEPEDREHLDAVVGCLATWGPDMVLLDSVGELMPLMGANSNSNDDVTAAFNAAATPLSKAGAAVVLIDHLAKNAESRRQGPVGAYGKTRIFNGSMVRVFRVEQFVPGQGGVSSLWVHKDRPGAVRRETVAPTDDSGDDADEIKRDNLLRWGVFKVVSAPVLDDVGGPVVDADGYPQETLTWTVHPPKGLHGGSGGADVPDPRKGGRPAQSGGVSKRGSAQYESALNAYLSTLCKMKREMVIDVGDEVTKVREMDTAMEAEIGKKPTQAPWQRARTLWNQAGRPGDMKSMKRWLKEQENAADAEEG